MEERTCGNCTPFRLHYIRQAWGRYDALSYGHCVYPRCKKRETAHPACPHWKPAKQEEEGEDLLSD